MTESPAAIHKTTFYNNLRKYERVANRPIRNGSLVMKDTNAMSDGGEGRRNSFSPMRDYFTEG